MQEATDESIQMVTASVVVSPFPDLEKSTSPLDNKTATTELNSIFQDSEFALSNLAIQIKSSCVCQVIVKANSSLAPTELISRIKSKIHGNLMHGNFTQDQLTLLVKSEHVAVKKLEPGKCKAEETTSKYKGTYKWLLTNPTDTAQTRCIKNKAGNATRICSISMDTGKSQWEKPKFKQCQLLRDLPDKIVDLANITISDENADDVAKHILNLINESPSLDEEETRIIVSKLSDISQCDEISMKLTKIILQIIDAVLGKQNNSVSDLHEVSNEILRIINHAGHKMEFLGRTANLTVASLALAVLRVDHTFEGMIFSIRSYEEGTDPEINNVTNTLTTYVVSASISDISIQNLADPVVITLQHIEGNQNYDQVHCAFWDFVKNRFLIFVFHCVMKESVREQWRTHLCCRQLQLDNFSDGSSRYELNVGYKQERLKKTFKHKLLTPSLKSTTSSSTFKSLGSSQGTPSEISFPSDNYDEDSYCCSPLSCDVVPNCVRRILPVEIKMNSIHKQRYLQ
ncbi:Putative G-protein coupled receptor 112 [Myotis brandtii]|uniref:Putative G-protein coupled receptor 112 n=1 Tax=Myotis brandtii TaxID=109478 RepID=S7PGE6_MYOBR|nr:Putative G-protein coupled receptor 112 [Myotis brandtii]